MKIAVASSGRWLESKVDAHTGRASCFIVYDTNLESYEIIDNWQCHECHHWKGVKSTNMLTEADVDVVIVQKIGPNAFRKLANAQIRVFFIEEDTVVRAIRRFREGTLSEATEANCDGHSHL